MKKEYIIPEFEIYKLKMESCLMAGSDKDAPVDDSHEEYNENAL